MRIPKRDAKAKLNKIFNDKNQKSDLERVLFSIGRKAMCKGAKNEEISTFEKILEGVKNA